LEACLEDFSAWLVSVETRLCNCEEESKMDEMNKNKMDDMEMDKVSGGRFKPPWIPNHTNDNANSMAANVDIDKTRNVLGGKCPD